MADKLVTVGQVAGLYGTRGWIKVFSYTELRQNILDFDVWTLSAAANERHSTDYRVEGAEQRGKHIIAKLAGVDDRERARQLIGAEIAVQRSALPACEPGRFYWADLTGLTVVDQRGDTLGVVDHLIETGAHDVIVLAGDGSRMIPFVLGDIVLDVDLERGRITVDWDSEYWD